MPSDRDRQLRLDARIRALEEQAEDSPLAYRARLFNRAGDLSASAGDLEQALRLWGRAIDAHLQVASLGAAAATCRKAIRRVPGVVRARCTLTLLAIGRGDADQAIHQMEDYVSAAQRAGRPDLARHHLRIMARAAADQDVRSRAIELLARLGEGAQSPGPTPEERASTPLGEEERWTLLLAAAHMSPEDVGGS